MECVQEVLGPLPGTLAAFGAHYFVGRFPPPQKSKLARQRPLPSALGKELDTYGGTGCSWKRLRQDFLIDRDKFPLGRFDVC